MSEENKAGDSAPDYVMDFDRLKKLTEKSFAELADELEVDKSFVTTSKTKPKIMNRIIAVYLQKFEKTLPLKDFLIESKK